MPGANPSAKLEVLTANRNYYVGIGGNDANDGLSLGTAFLTIGKAFRTINTLICGGYRAILNIGDGTYSGVSSFVRCNVDIIGNVASPGNVVLSGVIGVEHANYDFSGFQCKEVYIRGASRGYIINVLLTYLNVSNGAYCYAEDITFIGTGYYYGMLASGGGTIDFGNISVSGSPNYPGAFAYADAGGLISFGGVFTGSATGKRFQVRFCGGINTYGSGLNYIPGTIAGTIESATGGYYV